MSAAAVPERSVDESMAALRRANEVRLYRAELKKRINRRERDVPSILAANDDPLLYTMRVEHLLLAQRGWGRVKVNKFLQRRGVSPSKTVDGLTRRQRSDLVRGLYGQPPAR